MVEVMVFLLEMICDVNYIPLLFSRQRKGEAREAAKGRGRNAPSPQGRGKRPGGTTKEVVKVNLLILS